MSGQEDDTPIVDDTATPAHTLVGFGIYSDRARTIGGN